MHVRTITHDRYVKRFASIREISPADHVMYENLISKDLLLFLLTLILSVNPAVQTLRKYL